MGKKFIVYSLYYCAFFVIALIATAATGPIGMIVFGILLLLGPPRFIKKLASSPNTQNKNK